MKANIQPKTRPYWHVDLKWIFGILLLFATSASLLFFNLSTLTEKERAVTISASIVASLFSKDGLDDEKGIAEFRQKAALTPGDTIVPMDQFPWIKISKEDAISLGPADLRIAIFRQLTEPIYSKGVKGAAAAMTSDPAEQEKFAQQAILLNIFTKSFHDTLRGILGISVVITMLLIGAVVYFSHGWGRVVSPGIILLMVSPVGLATGLLLLYPPRDGDSPLSAVPSSIAHEIGNSLSQSHLLTAMLAGGLLLSSLIGKIVQTFIRRRHAK